eukprot:87615-Rhodomonas_salina.1
MYGTYAVYAATGLGYVATRLLREVRTEIGYGAMERSTELGDGATEQARRHHRDYDAPICAGQSNRP